MAGNDKKLLVIVALVLVLGAGAVLLLDQARQCPGIECPDCKPCLRPGERGDAEFLYLYPPGCEECDTSAIGDMFGSLGLGVGIYQNDAIPFPHLIVMKESEEKGNISTMVSALNRYNILQFLCLANYENACYLSQGYLNRMQECLAEIDVGRDTVAFHYSNSCEACNRSYWWVDELEDEGYNFLWLNEDSKNLDVRDQMLCLDEFLNIPEGVPQYICVSTGEIHTDTSNDKYRSGDIRSFVKRCVEGAEG